MPNSNATDALAAPLLPMPSPETNNAYGLPESSQGGLQAAQAIALPVYNDIGSDGFGDVLWRNYGNGANAVWNTPTQSNVNSEFITGLSNTDWVLTAAGDFNSDGSSDLLWRNQVTGQNALWYMNQGEIQERRFLASLGNTAWDIKAAGDFDGDGNLDILWRKSDDGASAVWLMNSDATIKERAFVEGLSKLNWDIVGAADFDGDASTDVLWRNQETGQNVIWWSVRPGQTNTRRSFIEGLDNPSWQIQGAGDLKGDGSVSILWRNYETGGNALWNMSSSQANETQVAERVFLPAIANPSWQAIVAAKPATAQSSAIAQNDPETQNGFETQGDSTVEGDLATQNSPDVQNGSEGQDGSDSQAEPSTQNEPEPQNEPETPTNEDTQDNTEIQDSPKTPEDSSDVEGSSNVEDNPGAKDSLDVENSSDAKDDTVAQEPKPEPQDSSTSGFDITFDYRFDTQGWFTAERRAVLEAAADVWEDIILDEFENTPAGTRTPYVRNPETGQFEGEIRNPGSDFEYTEYITDVEIDDLMVFVGARDLGSRVLGQAGLSGYSPSETRYAGEDVEPWLGSITFNSRMNWFLDETPETREDIPSNQNDFISTAVHEIGHLLGFSSSLNAFAWLVEEGKFVGPNALQYSGGEGVPLDGGSSNPRRNSHIKDGYEYGGSGETVMDPSSVSGGRQLPTLIDIAILDDLGYEVDYSQASQNASA